MEVSGWFNEHVDSEHVYSNQELWGNDHWDNSVGQDTLSVYSAVCSSLAPSSEEPTDKKEPNNYSSVPVGETGIKIRTRQPQNRPTLGNIPFQGTAPRRIRLQIQCSGESVCHSEVGGPSCSEEDEVQSTVTKVSFIKGSWHESSAHMYLSIIESNNVACRLKKLQNTVLLLLR